MGGRRLAALFGLGALVAGTTAGTPGTSTSTPTSTPTPTPTSTPTPTPASTPTPPSTPPHTCPKHAVLIDGDECSDVDQPCLEWATEPTGEKMRCLRFDEHPRCTGTLTHAHFCIDEYEYPNRKGVLPIVMKTWDEATTLCAARGERLCTGSEWTLACEGPDRLPYPYGFVRDDSACNVDRPLSGPYPKLIDHPPKGVDITLVDWRVASGSMDRCTSPYGVHDMTGNVDEWVVNESHHPYASGLKGGYWGPVRDRCRPMTVAHDERFAFYQIGLRCCADARAK